jgi:SAM-dependent methyltransferase
MNTSESARPAIPAATQRTPDSAGGAGELTAETVRLAYLLFLGREPESDAVVRSAMKLGALDNLRDAFFQSAEFNGIIDALRRETTVPAAAALVPVGAPPISVEWQADAATAALLLAHVKRTWTRLGVERPHWSVLSSDQFKPEEIANHEASFFASGAGDAGALTAVLRRHGATEMQRLLEFGCGIGRVTPHLARVFPEVTAADVSLSHMNMAREVVARAGARNVRFALVENSDFGMTETFDVWYTRIVLQHNPPPVIAMILRRAFEMLASGGLAVFQVPTYATGYRFRVAPYLAGLGKAGDIEMHVLPQPVVFQIARECGCEPLEVLEDLSAGPSSSWNSTTFVVRKTADAA